MRDIPIVIILLWRRTITNKSAREKNIKNCFKYNPCTGALIISGARSEIWTCAHAYTHTRVHVPGCCYNNIRKRMTESVCACVYIWSNISEYNERLCAYIHRIRFGRLTPLCGVYARVNWRRARFMCMSHERNFNRRYTVTRGRPVIINSFFFFFQTC